ncbi:MULTISPECIES: hypothetical protein [unclassified Sphingomonas]|uniref:hypothetical protein n=1 Tax=unclassified Sphingomonas TaxID=196159 RepID=UPI001F58D510|nr:MULTISPECIES: hypothetical protein [unclassified Sphingomonas]
MNAFGQSKPLASLSSTLLARKGQAKPAMRPQGFGGFGAMAGGQDDLGWNDMGGTEAPPAPNPPAPAPSIPPVLAQREVLREDVAAAIIPSPAAPRTITMKPVSVATATRIGRETHQKHSAKAEGAKRSGPKTGAAGQARTAFTLRLDQDRHLRLRLASALQNASAQLLVTAALDQFLQTLPEVDALVSQLPTSAKR